METFSALLALCAGNSPHTGEFPAQRPVTLSVDIFFDLCLNEQLSKQSWGWWFETPSRSLWRHCNAFGHSFVRPARTLWNIVRLITKHILCHVSGVHYLVTCRCKIRCAVRPVAVCHWDYHEPNSIYHCQPSDWSGETQLWRYSYDCQVYLQ